MKKSIKILSLVLALALICGALVVGVFAATANDAEFQATGVKVLVGQDLESAEVGKGGKSTDGDNKNTATGLATGMTGSIVARWGQAYVEASPYEDNKYVNFSSLANPNWVSANGSPYISTGYKSIAQMIDVNNAHTYKYQVMDLEVTFPTGAAMNFTPRIEQRGYKPDNSTSSSAGPSFRIWSEDSATDKNIYIQDQYGTDNPKVTIPATTWTHITFIIECVDTWTDAKGEPCAETDAGAVKSLDLYGYLVINDQIISKSYYGNNIKLFNAQNFCFSEIRLNSNINHATASTYIKDASIALDNFSWRGINPAEYAKIGELKAALATSSLAGWSDSLYDENDVNFGMLVATVGEGESIKYYDDLEKAIAETEAGGTVKLMANNNALITIDKAITVLKNGYTANFIGEGVASSETEDAYVFEATSAKMTVRVQACKCGNGCIAAKTIAVYPGANIWDAIVAEYGKEPSCAYTEGDIQHQFDGFTVTGTAAAFFEGGKLTKDAVVTEAMNGKMAILTVAYKDVAPIAKVFKADGTLAATYYAGTNFQTIQGKADGMTGSKIVLYADFSTEDGAAFHKYNSHSFTFDLNGYTFKHITKPNETAKGDSKSVFYPNGNGVIITITSSQVGGKIFNASCHLKSDRIAVPLVQCNADGSGMKFIGANSNGETTLSFYGNEIVQSYGKRASVEVDGGYYMRNRGDNYALFDMRVLADCSFKNATFEANQGPIFAFCGRSAGMGTNKANVTIDNCVMLASTVIDYIADPITVTITNSVIGGNMALRNETSAVAPTGDEVVIGKGCKLKEGITFDNKGVVYAGDVQDVEELLTFTTAYNTWKVGEDNFKITEYTTAVKVTKAIVDTVNVEFTKGGETVYTAKVYANMSAIVPMGAVDGTMGMVNSVATVKVPADVKEGDKIEVPADAAMSYVAGKVPVQFSMSITGHTTYNFFLPVVEGITYDAKNALQHNLSGYNPQRPATSAFSTDAAGNKWMKINTWPGMHLADDAGSLTINYSYKDTALSYTIESFGALDYLSYILNGEKQSAELKAVVANLINTSYYFNTVKGSSINAKITEVMASDAYKNAFKAYAVPADASNKAAIEKMAADGYVTEIALIATGANSGITAGVKMNGTYGFKMTTKNTYMFGAALVGETRIDGTGYMFMHNIRAYAFNQVFKIEVYEGYTANMNGDKESNVKSFDGEVIATYEWTLAGYINDNASTLTETQLAYAKSIYSYAEAAIDYLEWKQANGFEMFS